MLLNGTNRKVKNRTKTFWKPNIKFFQNRTKLIDKHSYSKVWHSLWVLQYTPQPSVSYKYKINRYIIMPAICWITQSSSSRTLRRLWIVTFVCLVVWVLICSSNSISFCSETFSVIWPYWAARSITSSTPLAFSGFTRAIRATGSYKIGIQTTGHINKWLEENGGQTLVETCRKPSNFELAHYITAYKMRE